MRFYEIDAGAITIDGIDSREMSRDELRSTFGMVLQDTWLFHGTIRENIAYGREDVTEDEIIAAAQAAHVDHFVRTLPDGYDTILDDDATNVSQGEKQLLTIARAFLADRRILILDEATSSVDTRTEVLIQRAMTKLMLGRTSFVIAHRLSTIRDADTILVMDHGRIVEQGTHEALLAKRGFYYDLYDSQFAEPLARGELDGPLRVELATQGNPSAGDPARDCPFRNGKHPGDLGLRVAVDEVEEQGRPGPRVERGERGPEVRVRGVVPRLRFDPADRREPATPAAQVVEGEAQGDRVEPGPDVRPVEALPRAVRLEVGLLGDVLGVALVAEDEDEPPDEVRVVGPDGRLEHVRIALRGGGAVRSRRRRHVRRRHGIGCPKQSPTPVAPARWSATMITRPSAWTEPGIT